MTPQPQSSPPTVQSRYELEVTVNGHLERVEVRAHETLLEMLRQRLGLRGTNEGCGTGDCGACAVLVDGKVVSSCLTLAAGVEGCEVLTVEGLAGADGELHPLQARFAELGAVQCGYCTPGMMLTAKTLLDRNPQPTADDVRDHLAGNLCRCTGYAKVVDAVLAAASDMRDQRR